MLKRLGMLAVPAVTLCLIPPANADVGGTVPGPGLCDYPGVGGSAMIMSSYFYTCDFPTEENGSHWHCEYGGAAVQAAAGVSILIFTAGIAGNVGALTGSCSWRCPDNTASAGVPNPPGAWKTHLTPNPCVSVPAPAPVDVDISPDAPDDAPMPAVTNPDNPNPDATTNPPRR